MVHFRIITNIYVGLNSVWLHSNCAVFTVMHRLFENVPVYLIKEAQIAA